MLGMLRRFIARFEAYGDHVALARAGWQWRQLNEVLPPLARGEQARISASSAPEGPSQALKHGPWTDDEWQRVLQAVRKRQGDGVARELHISEWQNIAQELNLGRTASSLRGYYRRKSDPRYAKLEKPSVRKQKLGLLRSMMKLGMQRMGGEATYSELCGLCKTDAIIQSQFGSQLNRHKTKPSGWVQEIESWEATVMRNFRSYFVGAGYKRGHQKVWRLPSQAVAGPAIRVVDECAHEDSGAGRPWTRFEGRQG